jgi:hypothetical protein
MGNSIQFAVLQKEPVGPTADQLKRAFKSFSNLTDADAVRLAVGAHGILIKHLGQDAARALQTAFQAEGIGVVVLAEDDLPKLPEGRSLQRVDLWPQALIVYDLLGRPSPVPWAQVALVAAGAAQHFEVHKTQSERTALRFNPISGIWPNKMTESAHTIGPGSQLLLEIILADHATRYQIDAAQFTFRHVIDRPGLSTGEKFVWLVREICRQTGGAILNAGARRLHQGAEITPDYMNRQVFLDEIVWLLWRSAHQKRLHAP